MKLVEFIEGTKPEQMIGEAMYRATEICPSIGAGLYACEIIRRDDVGTMATDGARIYYSVDFIKHLAGEVEKARYGAVDEARYAFLISCLAMVLIHEVMHIIGNHTVRLKSLKCGDKVKGIGTDISINDQLFGSYIASQAFDSKRTSGRAVLNPQTYSSNMIGKIPDGLSAERAIEELEKLQRSSEEQETEPKPNNTGEHGDALEKAGVPKPTDREIGEAVDRVMGEVMGAEDAKPNPTITEARAMSDEDRRSWRAGQNETEAIKKTVKQSRGQVKRLTDLPKLMGEVMGGSIKRGRSFRRPHRRQGNTSALLPVRFGKAERPVVFGIDTSGSMDEAKLNKVVEVMEKVRENYKRAKLTIIHNDTKIRKVEQWSPRADACRGTFHGGGGTAFKEFATHCERIKARCVIVYTDLAFTLSEVTRLIDRDTEIIWLVMGRDDKTVQVYTDLYEGTFINVDNICNEEVTV